MSKRRTTVEMRDYQRTRREGLRVPTGAIAEPPVRPVVAPIPHVPEPSVEPVRPPIRRFVTGETVERAMARPRVVVDPRFPSGFHHLPGDHVIGQMTQSGRDAILTRP